jgi:hypothetical protein
VGNILDPREIERLVAAVAAFTEGMQAFGLSATEAARALNKFARQIEEASRHRAPEEAE